MSLAESFRPRDWQAQIIGDPLNDIPEDKTKFKVVVAHRKAGKTVMALMYLFMLAYKCQDGFAHSKPSAKHPEITGEGSIRVPRFTYIAPTFSAARDIAWDLLKSIVPPQLLLRKPNETHMEIRLTNRCIINLKGADRPELLRGPGLYYALMDEYGFMKPEVWSQVIQPELGSTGGGAMFIGTPWGRNHFYDLFALGRDNVDNWKSWLLPATKPMVGFATDTPRGQDILAPGYYEDAKTTMLSRAFEQELECEFHKEGGMVFDRIDENVVDEFREYPEAGHRYRLGFDPALREDWAVITVLDMTDWKVKYLWRTNKTDADLLMNKLENEAHRWTTNAGAPEIVMDTTGLGDPMWDFLTARGNAITSVKMSNVTKRLMVENLVTKLNRDEIKIPRCEWLIDELKDYTYERLQSGKYRYGAPIGKHDDSVTALMLVLWNLPPRVSPVNSFSRNPMANYVPNRWTGY
jgi:hypothetical protein